MAARSSSDSTVRCLNRPSSRQIKRGSPSSSTTERVSIPNFRATEKRASSLADEEESALSLHQSGHAALTAESLRPSARSRPRNRSSWLNQMPPPHHQHRKALPAQSESSMRLKRETRTYSNT